MQFEETLSLHYDLDQMENTQRETDSLLNKGKCDKLEEYHSVNNREEIQKQATHDDDDNYNDGNEKQSNKQSNVRTLKGVVAAFLQGVVDVTSATSCVQLLEVNMFRSGIPLIAYVTGILINRKRK